MAGALHVEAAQATPDCDHPVTFEACWVHKFRTKRTASLQIRRSRVGVKHD